MMDRRERRQCSPIVPTSTPSMRTDPVSGSMTRYSTYNRAFEHRFKAQGRAWTYHREGRLSGTRAAAHADLLSALELKADVAEDEVQVLAVPRGDVAEGEAAGLGPRLLGLRRCDEVGRLGLELDVLLHALDRDDVCLDFGGTPHCK